METYQIKILISTKNRCDDLLFTLQKIRHLLNENVSCVVCDDGSTDDTSEKVKLQFPEIELLKNQTSKGYIYCRNKMLNETNADFAISLDDDAHFLIQNPIEIISNYFENNPSCGVIATRIFWSKIETTYLESIENQVKVKSYVGCGHIWRMNAWNQIPNYPEWFQFYGEENFASLQMFKTQWEVHYVPEILVQHRVDLKERAKSIKDFAFRYRRSLRADWYNYFIFFPLNIIPRKMTYSLWMQCKSKVFKGDIKVIKPLLFALFDLIFTVPKLIKYRNALTRKEYENYNKLNEAKIYWKP
jgi:glycosyltransferase involved in cell wall biosynthesis